MKEFKLNTIPKIDSGLKTPEDLYFEKFSETILEKTTHKEPKTISLFRKRKTIIMMVAAVLVLALTIPVFMNHANHSEEIDTETLENYLSYQSNVNQYDLINALDEEDINNIKPNIALEDNTIEELLISNNNLENYILE
ncbi:hypothetical protein ACSV4D_04555 [Flavobacterium sp. ARAG 55.4]|uniref:hypothetical protein n=1 Tax=Flavobacterium sp. ARAG 55.4 TaxID=3451357 RepID=UPI003F470152